VISVLVVLATLVAGASTRPNAAKDLSSSALIQAHLFQTRAQLAAATPADLDPKLRRQREFLLTRLEEYAARGSFPHNHVLPYQNPIFIDPHGTACAVGQLIIDSGHRALAERIAREHEREYLLEMRDAELAAWVASSGFTADELSRIQPGYTYYADEYAVVAELENGAVTARKTRTGEGGMSWLHTSEGAAEAEGSTWFVSPYDSNLIRDADGTVTRESPGGSTVYGLQVRDTALYAMTADGLFLRGPGTNWTLVTRATGARFWVNSATDVWALFQGEVRHFDGVDVTSEQLPLGYLASASLADSSIWADLNGDAWVVLRYYVQSSYVSKAFRRGQTGWVEAQLGAEGRVFGGPGQAWFISLDGRLYGISGTTLVEEVSGATQPLAAGAVLSNGSIVVAGKDGTVFERTPQGTWRNASVDSKVDFASVTESASGTAILGVPMDGCEGTDSVCPAPPPTTKQGQTFFCSVTDGLLPWALLLLGALLLARKKQSAGLQVSQVRASPPSMKRRR
jgi:hypothetical protein